MIENRARGEVLLKTNGAEVILCAEMDRLAKLETALGGQAFLPMFNDIANLKISTLRVAVECLTTEGNPKAVFPVLLNTEILLEIKTAILAVFAAANEEAPQPGK